MIAKDTSVHLSGQTGTSLTFTNAITIANNTNRILLVVLDGSAGVSDVTTSVLFNGTSMTKIGSSVQKPSNRWISYWYLLSPDTGTHNLTVTNSSSDYSEPSLLSLYGVKQQVPEASNTATSSTSSVSVSVTTVTDYAWVVAGGGAGGGGQAVVGSNTTVEDGQSAFNIASLSYTSNPKVSAGSVTLNLSDSLGGSNNFAIIAISLAAQEVPSLSPSASNSASASRSLSPSGSQSPSASNSRSLSPSASLSPSGSASPSASTSLTPSPSDSQSPSASGSSSQSPSASLSPSHSQSPSSSVSPSLSPSGSPSPSASQSPSGSPSPSASPSPTEGNLSIDFVEICFSTGYSDKYVVQSTNYPANKYIDQATDFLNNLYIAQNTGFPSNKYVDQSTNYPTNLYNAQGTTFTDEYGNPC